MHCKSIVFLFSFYLLLHISNLERKYEKSHHTKNKNVFGSVLYYTTPIPIYKHLLKFSNILRNEGSILNVSILCINVPKIPFV